MISLLLQKEYEKAYVFRMKINFSEPKIYTGGVDVSRWSTLSRKEQKEALDKRWYVYYSFRNPKTGKMVRQGRIKGGANTFRTKKERYQFLAILRNNLHQLLAMGFNPYEDNSELIQKLEGDHPQKKEPSKAKKNKVDAIKVKPSSPKNPRTTKQKTADAGMEIHEALEYGLKIKRDTLAASGFGKYKNHITRFQKWLRSERPDLKGIREIDKKTVVTYLNSMLGTSSSRNRNNSRTNLSSLFTTLENNEIIEENFIKKINVLKTKPRRNKTYTTEHLEKLEVYMKENDPLLLLFIQFISYNMLRPIEVCRLRVKDIDMRDKKLFIRAKNKPVKIKIIPDILLSKLPDLSVMQPDHFLFTPYGFGEPWDLKEVDRRNYFSRRFKKIKDIFNLGDEYGLYSYRHTNIGMIYLEMSKTMTPMEVKSKLMLITGHTTLTALEKYLHDIDAELPKDYSNYLDPTFYNKETPGKK
ncbi:tyrosine-type recombinase/integrase [Maribacter flavus]|nr:site-specific integrase [Maribacter flavus]